jgi:hypothetical protein
MANLDPDDAIAKLLATRRLLGDICGQPAAMLPPPGIGERYARAPSLAQRRFDRIAGETARAAAAGVSALMAREQAQRANAAALLARSLDRDLGALLRLVR